MVTTYRNTAGTAGTAGTTSTAGARGRAVPALRFPVLVAIATAAVAGGLIGFALTVGSPVPGVTQAPTSVEVGLLVSRVVLDVAALVTVGLSLLPLLIGTQRMAGAEDLLARTRPVAACSAVLWAVAALVALLLQTVDYDPGRGLSAAAVSDYVTRVGAAQALLIVAAFALLHAVLGLVAIRKGESVPAELRTALALFALLPLPVTGHAANTSPALHDVTMVSMEVHVVGAVAWTGGLCAVILAVAASRSLLSTTLPRFSKLATLCLLAVAATGLFNGFIELYLTPNVQWYVALFTTGYGQVLIGKTLCVAVLAALGGRIRFKLLPLIVKHRHTGLAAWATLELTVMGLAFGLAVVLSRAPVLPSTA